jgi:hypothetical protein
MKLGKEDIDIADHWWSKGDSPIFVYTKIGTVPPYPRPCFFRLS